ncbi:MAG: hypothetical protein ACJ76D_06970 [Solirubrobacterales bacterium]
MKYLKMLGLAAIAAAGLMAFLGAGTASATVLCETNVTTNCGAGWDVAVGKTIDFSAEETVKLTGPFGITIASCTTSTVEGEVTNTGGATATTVGSIKKLTFEGCNRPVTTNAATLGTLEIHNSSGTDNGTVTSNDTTVTIHKLAEIGFPETCSYLTNNTSIGTLTGKVEAGVVKAATFDIAATIPTETSGCVNGTWEGKYIYTGTTPFIVGAS